MCGGHPALDFVNSLDYRFGGREPAELIANHGDLLRFAEQSGLIAPRQARELAKGTDPATAARVLSAAKGLREAMAAIFYAHVDRKAPPAASIRLLERHAIAAQRHKELQWVKSNGESALQWRWGRFEKDAEIPVWLLAEQAMKLLTSDAMRKVRACEADTCRWLFLDTSRNGTRRWCKMEVCGNRMKARRFQARLSRQS